MQRVPVWDALLFAGVAELVDALDLGSSGKSRVGSSPIARTREDFREDFLFFYLLFYMEDGVGGDGAVSGGVEALDGG